MAGASSSEGLTGPGKPPPGASCPHPGPPHRLHEHPHNVAASCTGARVPGRTRPLQRIPLSMGGTYTKAQIPSGPRAPGPARRLAAALASPPGSSSLVAGVQWLGWTCPGAPLRPASPQGLWLLGLESRVLLWAEGKHPPLLPACESWESPGVQRSLQALTRWTQISS